MKTTVRILAFAAVAFAATLSAPAASAQNAPLWKQHAGEQIAAHLQSPDAAVQAQAMQVALAIAQRYPDVDLKRAISPLLDLARYADAEPTRLMAVSALNVIGDDFSTNELAQISRRDKSERVQRAAKAAVVEARRSR